MKDTGKEYWRDEKKERDRERETDREIDMAQNTEDGIRERKINKQTKER